MQQYNRKYLLISTIALVIVIVALSLFKSSNNVQPAPVLAQEQSFSCDDPQYQSSPLCQNVHPRIWLTPERLAMLKARVAANSPEWLALKKEVDYWLDKDPYEEHRYIFHYALAYLVTGEEQYAIRALEIVNENIYPFEMKAVYYARSFGVELAVAYDWLYDRLSDEDKVKFYTKMNEWTESVLNSWARNDPHTNHFYGMFLFATLNGIATHGDNPRAEEWFNIARYDKYENLIKQVLETEYKDGGWLYEGSDYSKDSYIFLLEYLWALETSTGENLFSDTTCLQNLIYNNIYVTQPSLDRILPIGDWSGDDTLGWIRDYNRILMLLLSESFKGSLSGQYAQWYLNHNARRTSMQESRYKWWDFFLYNPDAPEKNISELPLTYYDQGTGWIFTRSNWNENAVWLSFHCGALLTRVGHEHLDQNSFFIYKNSWLAAPANVAAVGYLYGETIDYNTIVVNVNGEDKSQAGNRDWRPKIEKFEQNSDYLYALGQAKGAYHDSVYGRIYLDNYQREFLYLRPDYLIIFDRLTTADSSYYPKWLLKSINEPTLSTALTTVANGEGKMFVKTLLPADYTISKVQGCGTTAKGDQTTNGWSTHLIDNDQSDQDYTFLNVLKVTDSAQAEMTSVQLTEEGNYWGVVIDDATLPKNKVLFHKTQAGNYQVTTGTSTPRPQITLTKSVLVDGQPAPSAGSGQATEAYSGQELTYTITYSNPSAGSGQAAEARNVVITDTIPTGATYVSGSATQPLGGTVSFASNTLTWTIPSVGAGQQGQVSFRARVE